jgi:SAM-dependent methyltransferase
MILRQSESDLILIAKLRRNIQEAVYFEDFAEAAKYQEQLKPLLWKDAKVRFADANDTTDEYPLLSVSNSGQIVKTDTAPKFLVLEDDERDRQDDADDSVFWSKPRMAIHTDLPFALRLERLYQEFLKPGSSILDLGACCATFLPDFPFSLVVGLGMNMEEMETNEALTERVVQNLNSCCRLPFPDNSLDAVICASALHYFHNPEAVLAEVHRVLRPAGVCVVSFSDRLLEPKAIFGWQRRGTVARCDLAAECFAAAGGMTPPERFLHQSPLASLAQVFLQASRLCGGDPFAALISFKGAPPAKWAVRLRDWAGSEVLGMLVQVPALGLTPFAAVFLFYTILTHR